MRRIVFTLIAIAASAALSSCGKLKEAGDAMKTASRAIDTAKAISKAQESGKEWELTEASARKFYGAVAKLNKKYPDIDFENSASAAIQCVSAGKSIEKVVPADGGIAFDEYAGLSMAISALMLSQAEESLYEEAVPELEESLKALKATDTSSYGAEQKEALENAIDQQQKLLDEQRVRADSPEYRERKEKRAIIEEARKAAGI